MNIFFIHTAQLTSFASLRETAHWFVGSLTILYQFRACSRRIREKSDLKVKWKKSDWDSSCPISSNSWQEGTVSGVHPTSYQMGIGG
jgi:hypothetical protein